jgi:hypothetical protein
MHQRLSRRSFASLASLLAALPPQRSRATGLEEVRKAASLLPGYGPPDIAFPPPFRGRWRVTRQVVDVQTPLGETAAPREALRQARDSLVAPPVTFEQRFVQDSERAVIADRSFNAERRTAAISGTALADLEARWEPSNPNVLTLARVSTSSLVETKVTKRSFEAPLAHRAKRRAHRNRKAVSRPPSTAPLARASTRVSRTRARRACSLRCRQPARQSSLHLGQSRASGNLAS